MTEQVTVYKMAWCFTCGTDECEHVTNSTQSLINALQQGDDDDRDDN